MDGSNSIDFFEYLSVADMLMNKKGNRPFKFHNLLAS